MKPSPGGALPGALVLSLDFELAWGLRDQRARDPNARERLLGARRAVPRLLDLFEEFRVAATWATVGFLFASTREELERFSPASRPEYQQASLSPYGEPVGENEEKDPLHYAASLVRRIKATPRQEIGSHTFSHYYCTEIGQTRETFRADLESACAIARSHGISLRSIVFPRNQHNPAYDDVLLDLGFRTFRGNPRSSSWTFADFEQSRRNWKRLARFTDAYVGGGSWNTTPWADMRQSSGLSDIRASAMLRPFNPALRHLESVRLKRIRRSVRVAARRGRILHLWWHPHNFGRNQEENLAFLRRVLVEFDECRERYGMHSFSMIEADEFLNWEGRRAGSRSGSFRLASGASLAEAAR